MCQRTGEFQAPSHLGLLGHNYSDPGALLTCQAPPRNKYPEVFLFD